MNGSEVLIDTMSAFLSLRTLETTGSFLWVPADRSEIMENDVPSNRSTVAKVVYGTMVMIGIFAVLRYSSELAYALGKIVGGS